MQRASFLFLPLLFLVPFVTGSSAHAQQSNEPAKIEAGFHFTSLTIGPQDPSLSLVVSPENTKALGGFGGRFTFNLNRHVALEAEGNFFPLFLQTEFDTGGRLVQGQFGVKAGKRFDKFGLFAKARPGVMSFSDVLDQTGTQTINFNGAPVTFPTFEIRRKNFFSLDVGAVLELYPSRRVLVRFDAGDTMVDTNDFFSPAGSGTRLSRGMKHRFQFSSGIAFRFLNPESQPDVDPATPDRARKFEVGAQFSYLGLIDFTVIDLPNTVLAFDEPQAGFGGRLTYNFTRSLAAEVQTDFYPAEVRTFANGRGGGRILQVQAGAKIGKRFEKFGVFGKLRPGAVSFSKTIVFDSFAPITAHIERGTHFSLDAGGVLEFYPTPRIVARFDGGDTMIRYCSARFPFFNPNLTAIELPADTRHQFQFSAGIGFRF